MFEEHNYNFVSIYNYFSLLDIYTSNATEMIIYHEEPNY